LALDNILANFRGWFLEIKHAKVVEVEMGIVEIKHAQVVEVEMGASRVDTGHHHHMLGGIAHITITIC
jgi:hypothetical protein